MPRTRSGRWARSAIWRMGMVEVLVAKMASGLDLGEHLAFRFEILEDRLDDEVGAVESAVVGRTGEQRGQPLVLGAGEPAFLQPFREKAGGGLESLADPGQVGVLEPGVDFDVEHRSARNA